MKKSTSVVSLAALAAILTGFAATAGLSPMRGDPARGRKVYVQKGCVDCHAVMGRGGQVGPDLAQVGKGRSHYRLVAKLWEHLPAMVQARKEAGKPWQTINATQMADLASYLFFMNFFDSPGDYASGKLAFTEKRCVTCHSVGGTGAEVGPHLDDFGASAEPLSMVSRMWSHGPTMVTSQLAQGLEVPKFAGREVADILAYLRGASLSSGTRQVLLNPADQVAGRVVFEDKQCSLCHPVAGVGEGTGPDLAASSMRYSVSEYAGILWNHGPMIWDAMLERGIAIPPFSSQEMSHLLAYLYSIDYFPRSGDAEVGAQLFVDRNCSACHAEPGKPSRPGGGPSLADLGAVAEPNRFASALWNHGSSMIEEDEQAALCRSTFSEDEMRDLTFFLRTFHDNPQ